MIYFLKPKHKAFRPARWRVRNPVFTHYWVWRVRL